MTTPVLVGDKRYEVWFLNTDAMNHMTVMVDVFAELDRSITRKVRFTDGSVDDIHRHGTIIFANKWGDHRASMDVFFIKALKSSVVSTGQLDERW